MYTEIPETRKFKSVIVSFASASQKGRSLFTYHKNLVEANDVIVKTEEEVKVEVTDDKVVVAKLLPSQSRQTAQQVQPEVTQHIEKGEYTKIMSMLPADATAYIGSKYVIPIYQ